MSYLDADLDPTGVLAYTGPKENSMLISAAHAEGNRMVASEARMTDESHFTFLFTDLEGSTPLWEQAPDTMPAALALHESILQTAIDTAGGQIFKLVGDAVCAVFAHPQQALRAAVVAQRTLHRTAWSTPAPGPHGHPLRTGSAARQRLCWANPQPGGPHPRRRPRRGHHPIPD